MKQMPKPMVQALVCGTCAHYCQHYVLGGKKFVPLWYGHCVMPRLKDRDPDETCEYWQENHSEE